MTRNYRLDLTAEEFEYVRARFFSTGSGRYRCQEDVAVQTKFIVLQSAAMARTAPNGCAHSITRCEAGYLVSECAHPGEDDADKLVVTVPCHDGHKHTNPVVTHVDPGSPIIGHTAAETFSPQKTNGGSYIVVSNRTGDPVLDAGVYFDAANAQATANWLTSRSVHEYMRLMQAHSTSGR